MNTIKQRLLTDWHPMRIIRLVFGVWALVQAFQVHDTIIGVFGVFFLYQAITNTGCCGVSQSCNTSVAPNVDNKGYIEYEEIK